MRCTQSSVYCVPVWLTPTLTGEARLLERRDISDEDYILPQNGKNIYPFLECWLSGNWGYKIGVRGLQRQMYCGTCTASNLALPLNTANAFLQQCNGYDQFGHAQVMLTLSGSRCLPDSAWTAENRLDMAELRKQFVLCSQVLVFQGVKFLFIILVLCSRV